MLQTLDIVLFQSLLGGEEPAVTYATERLRGLESGHVWTASDRPPFGWAVNAFRRVVQDHQNMQNFCSCFAPDSGVLPVLLHCFLELYSGCCCTRSVC